jgi:hypothetical protein
MSEIHAEEPLQSEPARFEVQVREIVEQEVSKVKDPMASAFIWRNAVIGLIGAIATWLIIMGFSFFATKIFIIPLAIILGLAVIPISIASGYTHRA